MYYKEWDQEESAIKSLFYLVSSCLILHILLSTLMGISNVVWRHLEDQENQSGHHYHHQDYVNLGSFTNKCTLLSLMFIYTVVVQKLNTISPEKLKSSMWLVYVLYHLCPTLTVTSVSFIIFSKSKSLRKEARFIMSFLWCPNNAVIPIND